MDKEVVKHTHNGLLVNYEKKCIWVSSNEVGELRAYYTEWRKSERERWVSYTNAYLWSLEKLKKRHREQTYGRGERGGEGAMYRKSNMETYIAI